MKTDFFEQFKQYLLKEHKDNLKNYIPYFETVLQAKDKLGELIKDVEKYYLEINYDEDKTEGYRFGYFEFHLYENNPNDDYGWQSEINHYYKMELHYDDRMWGYCECSPEDDGYNPIHNCCGNGCDWSAPEVFVIKVEGIAVHSFQGVERDLWELERKWDESKVDYEEQKRLAQLKRIEDEIKYLEDQRKQYLK